jgi:putative sterol carrier protein
MIPLYFKGHVAYTMAKYGMSMCVLGMAEELKEYGIAVNALWPRTAVWTAAMGMLAGDAMAKNCRLPTIMADSAYAILSRDSKSCTGNFYIDEQVLKKEGVTNFEQYAHTPGVELLQDFFLPEIYLKDEPGFLSIGNIPNPHKENESSSGGTGGGLDKTTKVFEAVKSMMNDDLKKDINAVLSFVISGQSWIVDATTSRPIKIEQSEATNADVTLITDEETFVQMAKGEVKATNAFMSGKLKIKGNIAVAMKAEKLFGQIKAKL